MQNKRAVGNFSNSSVKKPRLEQYLWRSLPEGSMMAGETPERLSVSKTSCRFPSINILSPLGSVSCRFCCITECNMSAHELRKLDVSIAGDILELFWCRFVVIVQLLSRIVVQYYE